MAHRIHGPIIGNSLEVWSGHQHIGCTTKLCDRSPIWSYYNILENSGPYLNTSWASRGVYILQDLYGENALYSFQDLKVRYSLPGFSCFFDWDQQPKLIVPLDFLPVHPLNIWIITGTSYTGLVSRVYAQLISRHDWEWLNNGIMTLKRGTRNCTGTMYGIMCFSHQRILHFS